MKKVKILFYISLLGVLFSCGHKEKILYYPTGEVEYRAPLSEQAKYSGEIIRYYKNGKIMNTTPFYNGNVSGVVKRYYPTGELEAIETWKQGKKHGLFRYFFPDGKIQREAVMYGNRYVDTARYYYPNGEIKQVIIYDKKGRKIDFGVWLSNGNKDTRYTRPFVLTDTDSISQGQDYVFEIQLGNRRSNVLSVRFLEPKIAIDSIKGIYTKYQYIIRSPKPGNHIIKATLYSQWARKGSDTIWTNTYPIEHSFHVARTVSKQENI
jgi:antitoxin component YwqK of YwqJK toxin-antitoxin module